MGKKHTDLEPEPVERLPQGKVRIRGRWGVGSLVKLVIFLAVLTAIAMITLAIIIGATDGGRAFVKDWLESRLGMELTVRKTRIGLPYVLVLEGVQSEGFASGVPGFSAEEIRIGFGISPRYDVSVTRCTVYLVHDDDGNWEPHVFSRLGVLPQRDIADISRITEAYRETMRLRINEGSIKWYTDGAVGAGASRFSFSTEKVDIAGRRVFYHFLSANNVQDIGGATVPDVWREWLAYEDEPYIEIKRKDGPIPRSARYFWEPGVLKEAAKQGGE